MKKQVIYLICIIICMQINSNAQNTGPSAPETMAFEPVDATDMVNLLTGDMSYVLPLLEVPGPNGGFPIVLSYHGGIAEGQEASWVGLGWNINTGAINRSVNGNPDDMFYGRLYNIQHADEQVFESNYFSASVPVPGISIGVSGSWGDMRSIGGFVGLPNGPRVGLTMTEGGGLSGSVGIGFGNGSVNASFSSEGIGVSANAGSVSAGVNSQGSANVSLGNMFGSVGISFSSKGISSNITHLGYTASAPDAVSQKDYGYASSGWDVNLFYVQFGQKRAKQWLHKVDGDLLYGILYSGSAAFKGEASFEEGDATYWGAQSYKYLMDVSNSPYDKNNFTQEKAQLNNNVMLAGYDYYNISAHGIKGSMSPRVMDKFLLSGMGRIVDDFGETFDDNTPWYNNIKEQIHYCYNSEAISGLSKASNEIDFYLTRLNESSFLTEAGNFAHDESLGTDPLYSGFAYDGGNENTNNSLKSSNHVIWYKNQDIYQNLEECVAKGFIETEAINQNSENNSVGRFNNELFDNNGIGAFQITASDGKIYHFSLPVYQFEEIYHDDIDQDNYIEQRKMSKYAYTWLLTAITGPDFIDRNNNGFIDESDYGYWVKFNYGRWADGYTWQKPFAKDIGNNDPYVFGRKQVYYLNSVETSSHIALFVKDLRNDGLSKPITRPLKTTRTNNFWGSVLVGTEITSNQVSSLSLSKIILLNKSDYIDLKQQGDFSIRKAGEFITSQTDFQPKPNYLFFTWIMEYNDTLSYVSQFEENVLDITDLDNSDLEVKSLKTIDLVYDHNNPLGYADNSNYANNGLLTLKAVSFKGKAGAYVTPPYSFDYYKYDKSDFDNWGFEKDHPENNSLKEITTPIGAKIEMVYESDVYSNEAISEKVNSIEVHDFQISSVTAYKGYNPSLPYEFANVKILMKVMDGLNVDELTKEDFHITGKLTITFTDNPLSFELNVESQNSSDIHYYPDDNTIGIYLHDLGQIENSNFDEVTFKVEKINCNANVKGGGLRVFSVKLTDGISSYITKYEYNSFNQNTSSGVVSFIPYKESRFIPYINLLPSPSVQYGNVLVKKEDGYGNFEFEKLYTFDVLSNIIYTDDGLGIQLGKHLNVENPQLNINIADSWGVYSDDSGNFKKRIKSRQSNIIDNTAAIGRMIEQSEQNKFGDVLNNTRYLYNEVEDIDQGIFQEEFYSLKRHTFWDNSDHITAYSDWHFTSANKIEFASSLKEVITKRKNNVISTKYDYDFNTGETNSIITINAKGDTYKTVKVPAYHIYDEMGFKSDALENKNMLTQQAGGLDYILTGDETENPLHWSVLSASVQTWKGDWNNYVEWDDADSDFDYNGQDKLKDETPVNIWRKHKSFSWKGDITAYGTYGSDFDIYASIQGLTDNWAHFDNDGINGWQKTSEVVRYNHYSSPIEVKDINGDYAATKKDPNNIYTVATAANAKYTQFGVSSFEYLDKNSLAGTSEAYYFGGGVTDVEMATTIKESYDVTATDKSNMITGVQAHTGTQYLSVPANTIGPKYNIPDGSVTETTLFRASVWLHANTPGGLNLKANVGGTITTGSNQYAGKYGNWQLYYLDFEVSANTNNVDVYVQGGSTNIYIDDFRVAPYESVVTSYTYDNAGQVTAIISNDNFATKYEYDAGGRLIATYRETKNGFDKVNSNTYHYTNLSMVSPSEVQTFEFGGITDFMFTVKTPNDETWTYTAPSWVSSSVSGDNIYITIPENTTYNQLFGKLAIKINGKETSDVSISQHGINTIELLDLNGTDFKVGDNITIRWNGYDKGDGFIIELYSDAHGEGINIGELVNFDYAGGFGGVPYYGYYSITNEEFLEEFSPFKIRVSHRDNPNIYDESASFNVTP